MTEPEKATIQASLEADSPAQDVDHDVDGDDFETPELAVWLSLGAIVVAGLYGLYLGTSAKAKQNATPAATSAYVISSPDRIALGHRWGFGGRNT